MSSRPFFIPALNENLLFLTPPSREEDQQSALKTIVHEKSVTILQVCPFASAALGHYPLRLGPGFLVQGYPVLCNR